ncbi:MAG: sugar phosphate isomerase/epimerase family protein [Sedimentisphaerales bacterium]
MSKENNSLPAKLSRRQVLATIAGAGAFSSCVVRDAWCDTRYAIRAKQMKVCIFSKHLQWLNYQGMAETAADIGFDGVSLTVRPRGHVLPENVQTDLPKATEAAKKAGIEITTITTAITDPRDHHTESILKTASELGIRYYRMGYFRYEEAKSIPSKLAEVKPILRDLAAMNKHYAIFGGYQNHAGSKYVGAAVWDLWQLLKDLDRRWIGCQFDIRHATVEGGTVWPIHFRLLSPYIKMIVAKDFRWVKKGKTWKTENCPLGEGMVDFTRYFKMLKQAKISGPISLHLEYPLGGAEKGAKQLTIKKEEVLAAMRRELKVLRGWLRQADL